MSDINNGMIDLGSDPVGEDFDPFLEDESSEDTHDDADLTEESVTEIPAQNDTGIESPDSVSSKAETSTDSGTKTFKSKEEPKAEPKETEKPQQDSVEKPPVFEYAGAAENIDDTSKTFDELRIEKSADFPELEDGKRVSWTVEYGRITKTVPDPKGTSIGKIKSGIETSKEFEDSLKKRGADKNPVCKVKPRVTAQSKGTAQPPYKAVFRSIAEAEAEGRTISIVPARDGKVYEIRNTEMGKFITPTAGSELLSNVRAGFIQALPRIPMGLLLKIISFFRYYTYLGREVLVNIYWDKASGIYELDVPKQTVTTISVESSENPLYANDRYIHYMDIHSHNNMEAFFSSTDDNDEKATRLYTVIGRLDKYFPDIKTRFSNGGKFMEIDPAEAFELVGSHFPNEWTASVSFRDQNDGCEDDLLHNGNGADTQ